MKDVHCWIIFAYRCQKGEVEILLLSKDGVKYEPIYWEGDTPEHAKNYLHKSLMLQEKDFYPSRDLDWWKSLSVAKDNKTMFKIATSAARLRDIKVKIPKGYKNLDWFDKTETFEKLKHWKGYTRAFKKIFGGDTYWECAPTEI